MANAAKRRWAITNIGNASRKKKEESWMWFLQIQLLAERKCSDTLAVAQCHKYEKAQWMYCGLCLSEQWRTLLNITEDYVRSGAVKDVNTTFRYCGFLVCDVKFEWFVNSWTANNRVELTDWPNPYVASRRQRVLSLFFRQSAITVGPRFPLENFTDQALTNYYN